MRGFRLLKRWMVRPLHTTLASDNHRLTLTYGLALARSSFRKEFIVHSFLAGTGSFPSH